MTQTLEKKKYSIKTDFSLLSILLIPIGVALNVVGDQLVAALSLPLYLDSFGAVLAGYLAGPWVGMLTGVLTNVLTGIVRMDLGDVCLAVLDLSAGRADRAAVNIRQVAGHAGQNTLGQQVVDGNLVTCVRQAGLFVVFEHTVDRNCLLVLGAIAGENACRVVADGVGALVSR